MDKLKVGVIGLGKQSQGDHIPAVVDSGSSTLVAVCDLEETLVNEFSAKYNVNGYLSFQDMFDKEKLDFVIVAVPHNAYHPIIEAAAKHKVHVIKEKPFAMNLEEAKHFTALAKEHGIHIMTTVQRHFNPIYVTFFQLIDKIGRPSFFEGRYTIFTDCPHTGWRGSKISAGGGCLIDMGYHIIDLIVWYFGLPELVFAEMSSTAKEDVSYDAEDTALLMIKYNHKKNFWGSVFVSRVTPPKTEYLRIVGTKGILELQRGSIERYSCDGKLLEKLSRENSWPSAFTDQIEYFVHIIKGEREDISFPEFHLPHMAIIAAAYESNTSGNYVDPHKYLLGYEEITKK
jgi:predicted dehydrogenase